MSQAETLLSSLDESDPTLYAATTSEVAETEEHIIVGADRFITVPDALKRIAVQYDHEIETVTFDCPRYWDGKDMSEMRVYINYLRPDGVKGKYIPDTITVDTENSNIMHFDWTIRREVTEYNGTIVFLVCVKKTDDEGNISIHWNTELNKDLYVSEGMECDEEILENYPDIINQLLDRQEAVEAIATPEAMQNYANTWLDAHKEELGGVQESILLRDSSTGTVYSIAMTNGKLTATETTEES